MVNCPPIHWPTLPTLTIQNYVYSYEGTSFLSLISLPPASESAKHEVEHKLLLCFQVLLSHSFTIPVGLVS